METQNKTYINDARNEILLLLTLCLCIELKGGKEIQKPLVSYFLYSINRSSKHRPLL